MHALYNASMFVYVTACSDRMVLLSNKFIPRFVAAKFFPNKVLSISNMIESNGLKCFEKKKEVLFVGRLDNKTKKIDLLLHIWSKIESVAEDWILNICGDGKDRQMLEQMCKDLNLQHVYFRGFVMPEDFYKTASVFCVTSAFEGWGLVIEEAASYGCVPLAFNSFEAVTDLITDGENGILIPPFDIDAYANAIKRLMNDEQERNRLAQNAQRDVVRFEPEIIMDQWENLFESVFNKR